MKSEEEKLFKKLGRKMSLTIKQHNLIEEGDRILLGLSGGKDSMILMELLADRLRAFPFKAKMEAVHIIPENIDYEVNLENLQKFAYQLSIKLHIRYIKPDITKSEKSPCFICSWERRKAIFMLSEELNCNKIAFGHHRDDALQTFIMNMLYHGSISSLPYSLKMFKGKIQLIRPLMDLWEKDLETYAAYKSFEAIAKNCPHEDLTKRKYSAELIKVIQEKNPSAKINLFHSMNNIYEEYLPHSKKISKKNPG